MGSFRHKLPHTSQHSALRCYNCNCISCFKEILRRDNFSTVKSTLLQTFLTAEISLTIAGLWPNPRPTNNFTLLRSEIPSGMCAKLHTVAASNNRIHMPWSLYYCLFAPVLSMVLFFTHIPFVVNHTFNATPPERLQQTPITVYHISSIPLDLARMRCSIEQWFPNFFDAFLPWRIFELIIPPLLYNFSRVAEKVETDIFVMIPIARCWLKYNLS